MKKLIEGGKLVHINAHETANELVQTLIRCISLVEVNLSHF